MKEQNPDIPFVVLMYYDKGILSLDTEEAVETLILDRRGVLLCGEGIYYYFTPVEVGNAARVLRDTIRSQRSKNVTKKLTFYRANTCAINTDMGKAIEAMATEIKTLQKKCEEGHGEATSSG